jgi:hypothetical protein
MRSTLGELADREEIPALLARDADVDQRREGIFPAFGRGSWMADA